MVFSGDASPYLERYQSLYGIDDSVSPAIPMTGMLTWTGTAWAKAEASTNITPTTLVNNQVIVASAGTAVPLSATSVPVFSVTIKAAPTNSGAIYIGDSSVSSSNGFLLSKGDTVSFDISDLTNIYVDSETSNDGVYVLGVFA